MMIILILAGILLVVLAAAVFIFLSFGKALYKPGSLSAMADEGTVKLEPFGPIVYGQTREDGTREFTLEAEEGITLAGFERGEGSPVLVIHGGPGLPSDGAWKGPSAFEGSRRFVYWHQRGSGRSTRPVDRFATNNYPANVAELDRRLGMAAQIADIERLRRALGVEKLDILGHSFGGFFACLYAIEFPERVSSLALVAPASMIVFPPESGGLYEDIRCHLPPEDIPAYDRWLKDFFDYGKIFSRSEEELRVLNAAMTGFYAKAMEAQGQHAVSVTGSDANLTGGWMMHAIFFGMGRKHDWSGDFSRIRVPTRVVFGSLDLTGGSSYDQYRVIPGADFRELSEADHFLVDDPAAFPKALEGFW